MTPSLDTTAELLEYEAWRKTNAASAITPCWFTIWLAAKQSALTKQQAIEDAMFVLEAARHRRRSDCPLLTSESGTQSPTFPLYHQPCPAL